ncbi:MAG: DUF934 domain-containing protein [Myxococcota bacterium]
MTKILSRDQLRDDEWQRYGDEQVEVADALIADEETIRGRGTELRAARVRLALEIGGDREPEAIADLLPLLDMVVIRFAKFVDGRAFSSARELRERWGFEGVLRAAGPFTPDQMGYLARVGFDAWELPGDGREQTFLREIRRFTGAYQRLPGDAAIGIRHR